MKTALYLGIEGIKGIWDYEVVAFRKPEFGDEAMVSDKGDIMNMSDTASETFNFFIGPRLILKRKKPKRIVFEEVQGNMSNVKVQCFHKTQDGTMLPVVPGFFDDTVPLYRIVKE